MQNGKDAITNIRKICNCWNDVSNLNSIKIRKNVIKLYLIFLSIKVLFKEKNKVSKTSVCFPFTICATIISIQFQNILIQKETPSPLSSHTQFPLPPASVYLVSINLPTLGISHKRNHKILCLDFLCVCIFLFYLV